jgi:hypothetical protein
MPLYPSEDEIARAVLGARAAAWPAKAAYLEAKHNMPRIDPLMGGRYWPAMLQFFDRLNGMDPEWNVGGNPNIRMVPPPPDERRRRR